MARVVGLTLIGLGLWVLFDLWTNGRRFKLRSRWVLLLEGTFAGLRMLHRVRRSNGRRFVTVTHEHAHSHPPHSPHHDHDHGASPQSESAVREAKPIHDTAQHTHSHRHEHRVELRSTATPDLADRTAAGIGVLHGIGVESPTQIAVFVASTAVGGLGAGLLLLFGWVGGLLTGNTLLALAASRGLLQARANFPIYAGVSTLIALGSIWVGTVYALTP